jgi:Tol biopolymer transport system component
VRGIWLITADGSDVRRLIAEPLPGLTNCGTPDWSPDGARICFDAASGTNWGAARILVLHVAGPARGLQQDLGIGVNPCWSSDGRRIAFYLNSGSIPDARAGIWIMNADGRERRFVADNTLPRWTPDGGSLICTESFHTSRKLAIVDAQTGETSSVISFPANVFVSKPSFVDDNCFLSHMKDVDRQVLRIVDMRAPPIIVRTVYDGLPEFKHPRVSPDKGTAVGIISLGAKGNQLVTISLTVEHPIPRRLEPYAGPWLIKDPCWSPDGRQIAFSCTARDGPVREVFEAPEDIRRILAPRE